MFNNVLINSALQLSAPALTLSVVSAVPLIESAVRCIYHVGQLFLNRGDYCYSKMRFTPLQSFKTHPNYSIVGSDLRQSIQNEIGKLVEELKNTLSSIDNSRKTNQLTVQLEESDEFFSVDIERLKSFSGLYRNAFEEFQENAVMDLHDSDGNPLVHENSSERPDGERVKGFVISSQFSDAKSFKLLAKYLNGHQINFSELDKATLLNLLKLANYLDIPLLIKQITLAVVESILNENVTSLDEFKQMENLKGYSKEFDDLNLQIRKFKESYQSDELKLHLSALHSEMVNTLDKLSLSIFSTLYVAFLPLFPTLIPLMTPELALAMLCYMMMSGAAVTELLPTTCALIEKTANTVYNVALEVLKPIKFMLELFFKSFDYTVLGIPAPVAAALAISILINPPASLAAYLPGALLL